MSYPVRAVCISEDIVLVGRASSVAIFVISHKSHLVKSFEQNCCKPIVAISELHSGIYILIFGRSFTILKRETCERHLNNGSNFKLEAFSDEVFCKHWIMDVCGTSPFSCEGSVDKAEFLFLLLSQNLVIKFDLVKKQCVAVWQCENLCNLYSGLLLHTGNFISVFAGTIFNSILFWKFSADSPNTYNVFPHEIELVGHDGVIFSMDYSEEYEKLVSVSDDRGIRLWQMTSQNMASFGSRETSNSMKSFISFFCHGARVQRAKFFGNRVISVGEDCLVCVLSFDAVLAKFSAHRGINIFGLAVSNKHNFFVTAGEDGAVLKWNRESLDLKSMNVVKSTDMKTEIRLVKLLSNEMLLYLTMNGDLVTERYFTIGNSPEREELETFPVLEKYSVWTVNLISKLVVFGSLFGDIVIYNLNSKCKSEIKISSNCTKVNSVLFVGKTSFLCSVTNQLVLMKSIEDPVLSLAEICSFNWPITNNNWPTCACYLSAKQKIACGDRNGTVWIYDSSETDSRKNNRQTCQVLVRCHSKVGVTDLLFNNDKLFTCGRDGKINVYSEFNTDDSNRSLQLLTSFSLPGSIFWITKLFCYNQQLFAFCFKSDSLVLFDVENTRVLSCHACGGGHRSFDLLVDENRFYFAFLKKCTLSVVEGSISAATPYDIVLPSLHGTKIHCLDSVEVNGSCYVFTGSEDCSVRISIVNDRHNFVTPITSINVSPCAVRFLQLHKVSETVYLLFIAGSRSFKAVFEISFNFGDKLSVDFKKIAGETTVVAKFADDSKFLSGDVTQAGPELFFILGSSASFISFYVLSYHDITNAVVIFSDCFRFSEMVHAKGGQMTSLNVVKFLNGVVDSGVCFLVGDNYGGATLFKHKGDSLDKIEKLCHLDLSLDLGRITSIDINCDIILLGGDSGSVTLAKLNSQLELSKIEVIDAMHCAQITSCKILSFPGDIPKFLTASIDQRLKVWKRNEVLLLLHSDLNSGVENEADGFCNVSSYDYEIKDCSFPKWEKVWDTAAGIEDISCCSSPNGQIFFVAGQGIGIVVLDLG